MCQKLLLCGKVYQLECRIPYQNCLSDRCQLVKHHITVKYLPCGENAQANPDSCKGVCSEGVPWGENAQANPDSCKGECSEEGKREVQERTAQPLKGEMVDREGVQRNGVIKAGFSRTKNAGQGWSTD